MSQWAELCGILSLGGRVVTVGVPMEVSTAGQDLSIMEHAFRLCPVDYVISVESRGRGPRRDHVGWKRPAP